MKYSEAMLKGYEKVGGRQCRGTFFRGTDPRAPFAVCARGAINLGRTGHAGREAPGFIHEFIAAWGISPTSLNDTDRMPWEHLYGMAVAAGL